MGVIGWQCLRGGEREGFSFLFFHIKLGKKLTMFWETYLWPEDELCNPTNQIRWKLYRQKFVNLLEMAFELSKLKSIVHGLNFCYCSSLNWQQFRLFQSRLSHWQSHLREILLEFLWFCQHKEYKENKKKKKKKKSKKNFNVKLD